MKKNKKSTENIAVKSNPEVPIPEDIDKMDNLFHINNMHDLKIAMNRMVREAGAVGIPIFVAICSPEDGKFIYNAMLPEEVGAPVAYGKFDGFLKNCIGFDKEEHVIKIAK